MFCSWLVRAEGKRGPLNPFPDRDRQWVTALIGPLILPGVRPVAKARDSVLFQPMTALLPLPPAGQRLGTKKRQDDALYRESAHLDAQFLEAECGASRESAFLDIGCGQARLLHGLMSNFGAVRRYVGIDVNERYLSWALEHMHVPFASFHRISYHNARYNPAEEQRRIDIDLDEAFDCVTMLSVFTHMRLTDIEVYLDFVARRLSPRGRVYLTAFVEDDVEPETENPEDYMGPWSQPLHCVRLNRQVFERAARNAGLAVHLFRHRDEERRLSAYVLKPV